jgi:hypothetical protein
VNHRPGRVPPALLAIMTAADLAQPVDTLSSSMREHDAVKYLRNAGVAELPVVEAQTGRLIGVTSIR